MVSPHHMYPGRPPSYPASPFAHPGREHNVQPMLARLARELPEGDYVYEPKWDGFRAVVFRDGDEVELMSRNGRPLARYFPEIVAAVRAIGCRAFVADGELLVPAGDGARFGFDFDFAALLAR